MIQRYPILHTYKNDIGKITDSRVLSAIDGIFANSEV